MSNGVLWRYFVAVLFSITTSLGADYVDLGTHGDLYQIEEKDLFAEIKEGSLKIDRFKMVEELKNSAREHLIAKGTLPDCQKSADRYYEPKITLEHDINLPESGVVIRKGETFNPLEKALLPSYLFFLSSENKKHLALAKKIYSSVGSQVLFIVDRGGLMEMKPISEQAYKGDNGIYKALSIECVPTIIVQQGKKFLVREFGLDQKKDKQ